MSNNNNDNSGALGLGILVAGLVFLAFAVYAIACFIAAIFTILSLLALKEPLHLWGDNTVTPTEAKVFLRSGVMGAIAVPVFAHFCAALAGNDIPDEWTFYLITGGYSFVSLLAIKHLAEKYPNGLPEDVTGPVIEHMQEPQALPAPTPKPFEYASWDDEQVTESADSKPECKGCWLNEVRDPNAPVFRR